jgi:two-component system, chemotaxis family, chemotaxis protein CheY
LARRWWRWPGAGVDPGETGCFLDEGGIFPAMTQIRALVVDDSQAMRRSIMYALQRLGGVVCVEAADGADGLKKFSQGQFDLVLTDINMPLMDGLKLISHIRQASANSNVPIVVITTEGATADRERAMTLGASAYLVKPVQAKVVLDTVKGLLNLH